MCSNTYHYFLYNNQCLNLMASIELMVTSEYFNGILMVMFYSSVRFEFFIQFDKWASHWILLLKAYVNISANSYSNVEMASKF